MGGFLSGARAGLRSRLIPFTIFVGLISVGLRECLRPTVETRRLDVSGNPYPNWPRLEAECAQSSCLVLSMLMSPEEGNDILDVVMLCSVSISEAA